MRAVSGLRDDWLGSLDLRALTARLRQKAITPSDVVAGVLARLKARGDDHVWIFRPDNEELFARAQELEAQLERDPTTQTRLLLYGVPFAVKDNIDVAGWPTTAGCPEYAYVSAETAPVVARLLQAGAILIGKTNLDQFATGLVGLRTPYGICRNVFDPTYIAGGSSTGSAVAVACGLVSFALGTDTAGSGRVPAALNNVVGLKPTRGALSTRGVVPACRSIDCVSILALTVEDAYAVFSLAAGYDDCDPYSRARHWDLRPASTTATLTDLRLGIPRREHLEFFGDAQAEASFAGAVTIIRQLGAKVEEIDFAPFTRAADLLYHGPWVAERLAAIEDFYRTRKNALHPVTREIIGRGEKYSAIDTFKKSYELESARRLTEREWLKMDALLVPTVGTTYTIEEVEKDPIRLNDNLGYYSNFVNLLDLCAISVPSGFSDPSHPWGVTFIAPAGCERALAAISGTFQRHMGGMLGATGIPLPSPAKGQEASSFPCTHASHRIRIAVLGAHLSGQPLNGDLINLGGVLVRRTRTNGRYRLYLLSGFDPPRPGLVRVDDQEGYSIDLEVWSMPVENFGRFVAEIEPPLCLGTIELEDGDRVKGFLCEPSAVRDTAEISQFGGWLRYLESSAAARQLSRSSSKI